MFLDRYEYHQGVTSNQFFFYSNRPKGRVLKLVLYTFLTKADGLHYYNVGFGDSDPKTGKISDLTVTDNKDREKILATVASTAVEFTRTVRKCRLVIIGSTPARTRLYQMKIANFQDEISKLFEIQGETENGWETFRKGINYLAFRFKRVNFTA